MNDEKRKKYMVKKLCVVLLVGVSMPVCAQRLLTLDSCRAMALRNNKQMGVVKVKQDIAENLQSLPAPSTCPM